MPGLVICVDNKLFQYILADSTIHSMIPLPDFCFNKAVQGSQEKSVWNLTYETSRF